MRLENYPPGVQCLLKGAAWHLEQLAMLEREFRAWQTAQGETEIAAVYIVNSQGQEVKLFASDYYMNLPYKVEISPEEDGAGFNTSIPDLKGCVAFGETVEEAHQTITEVKQTWIEIALERGWRIPEPAAEEFKD